MPAACAGGMTSSPPSADYSAWPDVCISKPGPAGMKMVLLLLRFPVTVLTAAWEVCYEAVPWMELTVALLGFRYTQAPSPHFLSD